MDEIPRVAEVQVWNHRCDAPRGRVQSDVGEAQRALDRALLRPERLDPRVGHDDRAAGETPPADERCGRGGGIPGSSPHERVDPAGALRARDVATPAPVPSQRDLEEIEWTRYTAAGDYEVEEA